MLYFSSINYDGSSLGGEEFFQVLIKDYRFTVGARLERILVTARTNIRSPQPRMQIATRFYCVCTTSIDIVTITIYETKGSIF